GIARHGQTHHQSTKHESFHCGSFIGRTRCRCSSCASETALNQTGRKKPYSGCRQLHAPGACADAS
ncbi:hypothetical protein, partial [Xanthomonas perforans]|uniref:hypothetical protein n=1 Tax=Xanthomonas perforans TaxID=442694 RepID=UPI001F1B1616